MTTTPLWHRVAAFLGLTFSSPFLLAASVVIKVASPGRALYRADRVGQGGQTFTMLKLRTMHENTRAGGAITSGNDGRVFPAGRVIRRLKIDELPQLLNVVRGQMALVGPRPEDPIIVIEAYQPWMKETLEVPPGIVGPGSLGYFLEEREIPSDPTAARSFYVSVLLPRKLARDLVYVRNRGVHYDLELILRACLGVVGADRLMRPFREREDEAAAAILRVVEGVS